jgi:hypothetical protein
MPLFERHYSARASLVSAVVAAAVPVIMLEFTGRLAHTSDKAESPDNPLTRKADGGSHDQ